MIAAPSHSPFTHVLSSNYAANVEEIQQIANLVQRSQEDLKQVNIEIARLEETLAKLRSERDALSAYIDDHLGLTSPFRRLPDDLLREIFLQCLEPYPVRSTKHAPLVLTTVCNAWRNVALTTPRLWSSIHIYIPVCREFGTYRMLVDERRTGIERWLDRSGSTSITFSVTFGIGGWTQNPQELREPVLTVAQSVVDTFLRYRRRWFRARFDGVLAPFLDPVKSLNPEEMPRLHSLTLYSGRSSIPDAPHLESLIRSAPSLRVVDLGFEHSHNVVALPLRWEQITEISLHPHLGSLEVLPALRILSFMQRNLMKCSFWIFPHVAPDDRADLPRVHLPSLQSFEVLFRESAIAPVSIGLSHSDNVKLFFDSITCPSLLHLGVDVDFALADSPLKLFLEKSSSSLRSFSTNLPLPASELINQCIRLMPSLTSLSLQRGVFWGTQQDTGAAIRALTPAEPSAGNNLLCPSLEDLTLLEIHSVDAERVMDLITKRFVHCKVRRLKSVKVVFRGGPNIQTLDHWEDEYRPQISDLRNQGLSIAWQFTKPKLPNDRSAAKVDDLPDGGHPTDCPHIPNHLLYPNLDSY